MTKKKRDRCAGCGRRLTLSNRELTTSCSSKDESYCAKCCAIARAIVKAVMP